MLKEAEIAKVKNIMEQLSEIDERLVFLWTKAEKKEKQNIMLARANVGNAFANLTWICKEKKDADMDK